MVLVSKIILPIKCEQNTQFHKQFALLERKKYLTLINDRITFLCLTCSLSSCPFQILKMCSTKFCLFLKTFRPPFVQNTKYVNPSHVHVIGHHDGPGGFRGIMNRATPYHLIQLLYLHIYFSFCDLNIYKNDLRFTLRA
jgi:hypothetical protein